MKIGQRTTPWAVRKKKKKKTKKNAESYPQTNGNGNMNLEFVKKIEENTRPACLGFAFEIFRLLQLKKKIPKIAPQKKKTKTAEGLREIGGFGLGPRQENHIFRGHHGIADGRAGHPLQDLGANEFPGGFFEAQRSETCVFWVMNLCKLLWLVKDCDDCEKYYCIL